MNKRIDRIVAIDTAAQKEKEAAAQYASDRVGSLDAAVDAARQKKQEETSRLLEKHREEKQAQFEKDRLAVEENASRQIGELNKLYESRRDEWVTRIYGEIIKAD